MRCDAVRRMAMDSPWYGRGAGGPAAEPVDIGWAVFYEAVCGADYLAACLGFNGPTKAFG